MTEEDFNILRDLVIKVNALEGVMVKTENKEMYLDLKAGWAKHLNSEIGAIYLKSAFEEPPDDPAPDEQ